MIKRFPIGPVTAITPFNFPLNLVGHKVAPAMACGNSMLLKPAPQAPLSALNLARLVQEAGGPPGQLNAFLCANEVAQPLVTGERIKMLSFTGSAAIGWSLKQRCGKKRVALELGGNAGVIVHPDADLDIVADRCAYGAFSYAGQSCFPSGGFTRTNPYSTVSSKNSCIAFDGSKSETRWMKQRMSAP